MITESDLGGAASTAAEGVLLMSRASTDTRYRHEFAPTVEAVPAARYAVRAICSMHGVDSDGPELAVSELVTNALRHARIADYVGVLVEVTDRALDLDVSDPAPALAPQLDRPAPADDAVQGRGLLIVAAVSDHVNVFVSDDRKHVRARFNR
ncbi:ATP-binding protein [Yinghuangia seranimata]|uniref:ATP-binding protein n=1 Tax=Yinghuangia seranimata TaxID=408067 RepID=UPI00248C0C12|nr:ATP-binding protein [Yinghuangia seranimata]MDI2127159.1 ATP-binding protein [Yinghuangia seranimata]